MAVAGSMRCSVSKAATVVIGTFSTPTRCEPGAASRCASVIGSTDDEYELAATLISIMPTWSPTAVCAVVQLPSEAARRARCAYASGNGSQDRIRPG